MRWIIRATLAALLTLGLLGLAAYGHVAGWRLTPVTPEALTDTLRPGLSLIVPEGNRPFPTVLLFHGCGGLASSQFEWADRFRAAGWASLVVDSMGPRNLTELDVCSGQALLGRERAGDVLVALAAARRNPQVDPQRLVIAGWSHGGWTVIEALAMNAPHELPPNLTRAPEGGLDGVVGAILVYPYCGIVARTSPWDSDAHTLLLLASEDTLADPEPCIAMGDRLKESGRAITTRVYPGTTHGFDHREPPESSGLLYNAEATELAHRDVLEFLAQVGGPSSR